MTESTELDAEVRAMQTVLSALEPLTPSQQKRVLTWAENRCGVGGKILDVLTEAVKQVRAENDALKGQLDDKGLLCACGHPGRLHLGVESLCLSPDCPCPGYAPTRVAVSS